MIPNFGSRLRSLPEISDRSFMTGKATRESQAKARGEMIRKMAIRFS